MNTETTCDYEVPTEEAAAITVAWWLGWLALAALCGL